MTTNIEIIGHIYTPETGVQMATIIDEQIDEDFEKEYKALESKSNDRLVALKKSLPILEEHCGEVFLESIRKAMEP